MKLDTGSALKLKVNIATSPAFRLGRLLLIARVGASVLTSSWVEPAPPALPAVSV